MASLEGWSLYQPRASVCKSQRQQQKLRPSALQAAPGSSVLTKLTRRHTPRGWSSTRFQRYCETTDDRGRDIIMSPAPTETEQSYEACVHRSPMDTSAADALVRCMAALIALDGFMPAPLLQDVDMVVVARALKRMGFGSAAGATCACDQLIGIFMKDITLAILRHDMCSGCRKTRHAGCLVRRVSAICYVCAPLRGKAAALTCRSRALLNGLLSCGSGRAAYVGNPLFRGQRGMTHMTAPSWLSSAAERSVTRAKSIMRAMASMWITRDSTIPSAAAEEGAPEAPSSFKRACKVLSTFARAVVGAVWHTSECCLNVYQGVASTATTFARWSRNTCTSTKANGATLQKRHMYLKYMHTEYFGGKFFSLLFATTRWLRRLARFGRIHGAGMPLAEAIALMPLLPLPRLNVAFLEVPRSLRSSSAPQLRRRHVRAVNVEWSPARVLRQALALVRDSPPTPQLPLPPRNSPRIVQQQQQLSPSMAAATECVEIVPFRRRLLEVLMAQSASSLPGSPLPASALQQQQHYDVTTVLKNQPMRIRVECSAADARQLRQILFAVQELGMDVRQLAAVLLCVREVTATAAPALPLLQGDAAVLLECSVQGLPTLRMALDSRTLRSVLAVLAQPPARTTPLLLGADATVSSSAHFAAAEVLLPERRAPAVVDFAAPARRMKTQWPTLPMASSSPPRLLLTCEGMPAARRMTVAKTTINLEAVQSTPQLPRTTPLSCISPLKMQHTGPCPLPLPLPSDVPVQPFRALRMATTVPRLLRTEMGQRRSPQRAARKTDAPLLLKGLPVVIEDVHVEEEEEEETTVDSMPGDPVEVIEDSSTSTMVMQLGAVTTTGFNMAKQWPQHDTPLPLRSPPSLESSATWQWQSFNVWLMEKMHNTRPRAPLPATIEMPLPHTAPPPPSALLPKAQDTTLVAQEMTTTPMLGDLLPKAPEVEAKMVPRSQQLVMVDLPRTLETAAPSAVPPLPPHHVPYPSAQPSNSYVMETQRAVGRRVPVLDSELMQPLPPAPLHGTLVLIEKEPKSLQRRLPSVKMLLAIMLQQLLPQHMEVPHCDAIRMALMAALPLSPLPASQQLTCLDRQSPRRSQWVLEVGRINLPALVRTVLNSPVLRVLAVGLLAALSFRAPPGTGDSRLPLAQLLQAAVRDAAAAVLSFDTPPGRRMLLSSAAAESFGTLRVVFDAQLLQELLRFAAAALSFGTSPGTRSTTTSTATLPLQRNAPMAACSGAPRMQPLMLPSSMPPRARRMFSTQQLAPKPQQLTLEPVLPVRPYQPSGVQDMFHDCRALRSCMPDMLVATMQLVASPPRPLRIATVAQVASKCEKAPAAGAGAVTIKSDLEVMEKGKTETQPKALLAAVSVSDAECDLPLPPSPLQEQRIASPPRAWARAQVELRAKSAGYRDLEVLETKTEAALMTFNAHSPVMHTSSPLRTPRASVSTPCAPLDTTSPPPLQSAVPSTSIANLLVRVLGPRQPSAPHPQRDTLLPPTPSAPGAAAEVARPPSPSRELRAASPSRVLVECEAAPLESLSLKVLQNKMEAPAPGAPDAAAEVPLSPSPSQELRAASPPRALLEREAALTESLSFKALKEDYKGTVDGESWTVKATVERAPIATPPTRSDSAPSTRSTRGTSASATTTSSARFINGSRAVAVSGSSPPRTTGSSAPPPTGSSAPPSARTSAPPLPAHVSSTGVGVAADSSSAGAGGTASEAADAQARRCARVQELRVRLDEVTSELALARSKRKNRDVPSPQETEFRELYSSLYSELDELTPPSLQLRCTGAAAPPAATNAALHHHGGSTAPGIAAAAPLQQDGRGSHAAVHTAAAPPGSQRIASQQQAPRQQAQSSMLAPATWHGVDVHHNNVGAAAAAAHPDVRADGVSGARKGSRAIETWAPNGGITNKICFAHRDGRCTSGTGCPFVHGELHDPPPTLGDEDRMRAPNGRLTNKVCRDDWFPWSTCNRGRSCPFVHLKPNKRPKGKAATGRAAPPPLQHTGGADAAAAAAAARAAGPMPPTAPVLPLPPPSPAAAAPMAAPRPKRVRYRRPKQNGGGDEK
ncbi:hypothetical protein JKP88DRAFT_299972 [Tribonema minus]|uniref:C3H1-type domain-containing protein n=1 Tax=Tribonema minus TaxID=303371 RepID=A0A836CKK3_9STRA|nr:hypothetical protein JKP88DRAFT_299972 [Tribonema minus]